jgi:hypothetical protein
MPDPVLFEVMMNELRREGDESFKDWDQVKTEADAIVTRLLWELGYSAGAAIWKNIPVRLSP